MGFERIVPAGHPPPIVVRCECALPPAKRRGAGTLWRCDRCKELWIWNPYESGQFGLATAYEHIFWLMMTLAFLCLPFLAPGVLMLGRDPWREWRRVRWMRKVTIIGSVFFALITVPVGIGVLGRP